jgi:hypothetical protein
MAQKIKCQECGKLFEPPYRTVKYCSDLCRKTRTQRYWKEVTYPKLERAGKTLGRYCPVC